MAKKPLPPLSRTVEDAVDYVVQEHGANVVLVVGYNHEKGTMCFATTHSDILLVSWMTMEFVKQLEKEADLCMMAEEG